MIIDDTLDFGKYNGLTVREVYQGSNEINKELLKSYLKQRIEKPDANNDCSVLVEFANFEISATLLRITPVSDDLKGNWTSTIEGFFKDVYEPTTKWVFEIESLDDVNKQFSKDKEKVAVTNGNPSYIEWCIKNVDDFYLTPDTLSQLSEMNYFRFIGIEVLLKVDDIYEYKPKFVIKKHVFSEDMIRLNNEKYEASISENYVEDDDCYNNDDWDYSDDDDYCGGCESSPCRCSDPDPG